MRKSKRKKKVARETGDSHPLAEDEVSIYGVSNLDEQIGRLWRTTIVMLILKIIMMNLNLKRVMRMTS